VLTYVYTSEREFLSETIMNILKNIAISAGICLCFLGITDPKLTNADLTNSPSTATYVVKNTSWVLNTVKKINVVVTAYSSTPDQTDDTPFITASGKCVKDGIIANNMLPFGTKVRIPELYGNKVFTVEDRMNKKKSDYHIDIWMADLHSAINFGVKNVKIEILES